MNALCWYISCISLIAGSIGKLFEGATHFSHIYGRLAIDSGVTEEVIFGLFFSHLLFFEDCEIPLILSLLATALKNHCPLNT
jgi:hypothetical protein